MRYIAKEGRVLDVRFTVVTGTQSVEESAVSGRDGEEAMAIGSS